ncbi:MAG: Unknown protein [uncultured Campylobacterales bacterium]|uniref:PDZ domain-containing protein n=1 Tax=uncultured Campylobacterales bacterium TaxID=352960 RepID=A0A6S6SC71_9BACT|nr:MAG: Unknown protein [uncultured Campylobacterales bacterium]
MKFNIQTISSYLFIFITLFLLVKIPIMVIDMKYLPDTTKTVIIDDTDYYKRFEFINAFAFESPKPVARTNRVAKPNRSALPTIEAPRIIEKKKQPKLYDINRIKLITIYIEGKKSFITFIDDREMQIVDLYEIYKGYTLSSLTRNYAVFTDDNQNEYLMLLIPEDDTKSKVRSKRSQKNAPVSNKVIAKKDLQPYLNGSKDVLRDIRFSPQKESGKIIGYKIQYVKARSPLASLGLKRGDIVIELNGRTLSKMSNLMYFYGKRKSITKLDIKYIRDEQEMEINYEIK